MQTYNPDHNNFGYQYMDNIEFSKSLTQQQLQNFKYTVITYDKGAIWKRVEKPLYDVNFKKIYCKGEPCHLNLNSVTSMRYAPLYSTKNSIGVIIASGNVGSYLSNRKDEINTYLSRDAGLTWFEVIKLVFQ